MAPSIMVAPRSTARSFWVIAALGVALFGGTVTATLRRSTYRADIATLCFAESRSGHSLDRGMNEVHAWARAHLATPEGNELFDAMRSAPFADRAPWLDREARAAGVVPCPMVGALARVTAEAERRAELQELCSGMTFPDLVERDDEGRLDLLERWIAAGRRSPRTEALGDELRAAPVAERPRVLRDAARAVDVFSCEVARSLEAVVPGDAQAGDASAPDAPPAPQRAAPEAGPASPR